MQTIIPTQPTPMPVKTRISRLGVAALMVAAMAVSLVGFSSPASAAAPDCGSANLTTKLVTTIAGRSTTTMSWYDRGNACENNSVFVDLFSSEGFCKNYGIYQVNSRVDLTPSIGGKNTTVGTIQSGCKSTFGVPTPWGGVGVSKTIKNNYRFTMQGASAVVSKWGTTS